MSEQKKQDAPADTSAPPAPETISGGAGDLPGSDNVSEQASGGKKSGGKRSGGKKSGGKKSGVMVVRGPARGRWRAGRHFGPQPVEIPLAELTQAARKAIEGDPVLSVEVKE